MTPGPDETAKFPRRRALPCTQGLRRRHPPRGDDALCIELIGQSTVIATPCEACQQSAGTLYAVLGVPCQPDHGIANVLKAKVGPSGSERRYGRRVD